MLGEESGFVVEPMHLSDVPAVLAIEHVSFRSPWSARAYHYELERNERSHYFVLRRRGGQEEVEPRLLTRLRRFLLRRPTGEIVGYGGFWVSGSRAHISTLAVAPQWRRQGLGLFLVLHMLNRAAALGMREVALEVRVSNQAAQNLYRKCGFKHSGRQRGYYRDTGEDALLMKTPSLTHPTYQARLASLWEELEERGEHR
ncbi:MAG: ribosomal protein S18-alanine N-acetyltransferase [Chloroflexota bacterium]|nr:ribosomal protein S18-alanine N-acetyltransferase [Chloroflexota bacterium]